MAEAVREKPRKTKAKEKKPKSREQDAAAIPYSQEEQGEDELEPPSADLDPKTLLAELASKAKDSAGDVQTKTSAKDSATAPAEKRQSAPKEPARTVVKDDPLSQTGEGKDCGDIPADSSITTHMAKLDVRDVGEMSKSTDNVARDAGADDISETDAETMSDEVCHSDKSQLLPSAESVQTPPQSTAELVPDTKVLVPDTSQDVPDTHTLVPDSHAAVPDTKTLLPDTKTLVPDTSVGVPDTKHLASATAYAQSLSGDVESGLSGTKPLSEPTAAEQAPASAPPAEASQGEKSKLPQVKDQAKEDARTSEQAKPQVRSVDPRVAWASLEVAKAPQHRSMYPRLAALSAEREAGRESVYQPMTQQQLETLYYNPMLVKNSQLIDEFVVHENKKENHEFYEILLNYYRARKHLLGAEEDIRAKQETYTQQLEAVWVTSSCVENVQARCGDGSRVSTTYPYEKVHMNQEALKNLSLTLQSIRELLQEELSMHAYSSQLSRLQVESYIHNLYMSCPGLRDIPKNCPVQTGEQHRPELRHQVTRLRDCISVLFLFHRRPCKDSEFLQAIRAWTQRLISSLLRVASFADHLFILNHVLRCPAGVGQWAASLVQVAPPGPSPTPSSFGGPLLDHTVTILATLLLPTKAREEFMCQMQQSLTPEPGDNQDMAWILVDSDGEEDEDPANAWVYLHENDLVAMLRQLPLSHVFTHVLMGSVQDSGAVDYHIRKSSVETLLKLLAFCTVWVGLLGRGLMTYCLTRYRQLNKRIGKLIRQTVSFVSDHWLNFKQHNQSMVGPQRLQQLQVEFDMFFLRSAHCILTAQRLGSWQFLAEMPYTSVSKGTMWRLLWLLHQHQRPEFRLESLPDEDTCRADLLSTSSAPRLSDSLEKLPVSETIYLLSTLANMVQFRPSEESDLVNCVALSLFEIAYLATHTREFCSKSGRELLASVSRRHPSVMSVLLQRCHAEMDNLGSMALHLFHELPLHCWIPTDPDLTLLQQWLLNSELSSIPNQLSRLILTGMNWGLNTELNFPALDVSLHRQVAVLVAEAYTRYISSRNMAAFIMEGMRQMVNAVRSASTWEQQFSNWAWSLLLRLRLHRQSVGGMAPSLDPPSLADPTLTAILAGTKARNPVACFVAVLMTQVGHEVSGVVSEGLDLVLEVISHYQYTAAIHILSCLVPDFLATPDYLLSNSKFTKILQLLVGADESMSKMAKVVAIQVPGLVTGQLGNMVQRMVWRSSPASKQQALSFWVEAVTSLPQWFTDRDCSYLVDLLVRVALVLDSARPPQDQDSGGLALIHRVLVSKFHALLGEERSQSVVSSVVSWITSGVTLPSFLPGASCPEFPWLAYAVLMVEGVFETSSGIWGAITQDLHRTPKLSAEQALRNTVSRLKLENAPSLARLNIYRWAQQALDTPLTHPLLPILWQNFFVLFLGREKPAAGLPQRASVGERFFQSYGYSSMAKKMKKRLYEASEYHREQHQKIREAQRQEGSSDGSSQAAARHQELANLYQTYALWMEEARLHDAELYLPALPPQYDAMRLSLIFQRSQVPWLSFVDLPQLVVDIDTEAKRWEEITNTPIPKDTYKDVEELSQDPSSSTRRILKRLGQFPVPLEAPPVHPLHPPVPDISPSLVLEKSALMHLINSDLRTLLDYTKVFANRVANHCAVDSAYLELIPELYSNEWYQTTVAIECRSKVNPLHKCSHAAVVPVRVQQKRQNAITQRKVDENRAEYKQVMIEGQLPPPQAICIAVVHIENALTALIKLAQSSTEDSRVAQLSETACMLFFHLVSMVNDEINFYPPAKHFFSSCAEILGNEFVSKNQSQTALLLQFCLDNPSLSSLTVLHFNPNIAPASFASMYSQLISALQQQNLELVFALLSKFDVRTWLTNDRPSAGDRRSFITTLGSALTSCGPDPKEKSKLVFDVYCQHLSDVLSSDFPMNLSEVLNLILQGSAAEQLHPGCWKTLLSVCFHQVGGQPSSPNPDLPPVLDIQLPTGELQGLIGSLSQYFMQTRMATEQTALFGLYPGWWRYSGQAGRLLASLLQCLVTKLAPNLQDMNPQQVLDMTWQLMVEAFRPWLQAVVWRGQFGPPWVESDADHAIEVLRQFYTVIMAIMHQYSAVKPEMRSVVLSQVLVHYMTAVVSPTLPHHVAGVYVDCLSALPWNLLQPDLNLLEIMAQFREAAGGVGWELLGNLLPCIDWVQLLSAYNQAYLYQAPEIVSRVRAALLLLLVQCSPNAQLMQQAETMKMFVMAEQQDWNSLTAESYMHVSRWFMETSEASIILEERSSPLTHGLRLMKMAAGFSTSPSVVWSESVSARRQTYMSCVVQLLCQASFLSSAKLGNLHTVIMNLLTELEAVEGAITDRHCQEVESMELCRSVLSLLNNCSPEGGAVESVMGAIRQWLQHSPSSVLLMPFTRAASRCLASLAQMVAIMEECCQAYFAPSHIASSGTWGPILAALTVPELNQADFLAEALSGGGFLVLTAFHMQRRPFCQSLQDEAQLLELLLQWTEQARPSESNEAKLLLWWRMGLDLVQRQVDFGAPHLQFARTMRLWAERLLTLGEDRASTGILGTIGLGKKSALSLQFRVICRALAAFLAGQVLSDSAVRTDTATKLSQTSLFQDCLTALKVARDARQYQAFKETANWAVLQVVNPGITLADSTVFLSHLASTLYPGVHYLGLVTAPPQR